jgi:hypothetical protein
MSVWISIEETDCLRVAGFLMIASSESHQTIEHAFFPKCLLNDPQIEPHLFRE